MCLKWNVWLEMTIVVAIYSMYQMRIGTGKASVALAWQAVADEIRTFETRYVRSFRL